MHRQVTTCSAETSSKAFPLKLNVYIEPLNGNRLLCKLANGPGEKHPVFLIEI